ncbi:hypothetical protein SEVIR_3G082401v4 [Setaria viridis]
MDGDLCVGWSNYKIFLAHSPLCLAWPDCSLQNDQKGNFMAVGTMSTEIGIWNLDIVDALTPHTVLGGKLKHKKGSHEDSVLGVAWNKEYMNVLASASADKTVKIWDVAAGKCVTTLEHHDAEAITLRGLLDCIFASQMKDVKNCAPNCVRWSVEADVETVAWDPDNEHSFVVSLENGMVQAFDKRISSSNGPNSSLALFTLHAHEKAVTSISFGPSAPNFLATSSTDKTVAVVMMLHCVIAFSNDDPFLLAMGGSTGKIKISNTLAQR